MLYTALQLAVCGLYPDSSILAPSDFPLLEPSNKHLAGKQFSTDVNVKQVVTCLTQLTMQKRRNSERMTSPKGYIAYIVEEGIT
jgi:hypothetical protein